MEVERSEERTVGTAIDLSRFRSLLVVKPSSLGDIVHTLPAVAAIRDAHPHLRVRWLANTEWMPLVEGSPVVDEVVEFPRSTLRGGAALTRGTRWLRELRGSAPAKTTVGAEELAIDFQGLLRSALIARTCGAQYVVGPAEGREGSPLLYDHTVCWGDALHAVDRYLAMVSALGVPVPRREDVAFPLPEGEMPEGIPKRRRYVVLHPYARGEGKSIDDHCIRAFCDGIKKQLVVIAGIRPEPAGPPPKWGDGVIDLSGRTSLTSLIGLCRGATAVVSVDSGPMHIAAAVAKRTLGIHTWSDPRKVGPYTSGCLVWKSGEIVEPHTWDGSGRTVTPQPEEIAQIASSVE